MAAITKCVTVSKAPRTRPAHSEGCLVYCCGCDSGMQCQREELVTKAPAPRSVLTMGLGHVFKEILAPKAAYDGY